MATVPSDSKEKSTLCKCWKMASFFEKLILGVIIFGSKSWGDFTISPLVKIIEQL